jgi:RNA polymerase sigma factor (sigma-70 family)
MELAVSTKSPQVKFSDLQIIQGTKEEDERVSQKYYSIFYHKYKPYIYKIALRLCENYHDSEEMSIDITQQTFINAYPKLKSFDLSQEPNTQKHEAIIKAWLGTIAKNCFKKEYSIRKFQLYIDDLPSISDKPTDFEDGVPLEIPNEFRTKLQASMNELTEEQRHILLTYVGEGCIDSTRHLSDNAMRELCSMYNTSSSNIRQIKKRTLDKIKKNCL